MIVKKYCLQKLGSSTFFNRTEKLFPVEVYLQRRIIQVFHGDR
ncbi:MAG: hypothetical protein AAF915_00525 [Cyanobacteria bacterium P01_D01_bin.50]